MTNTTSMKRLFGLLAVLTLTLAACGTDDDTDTAAESGEAEEDVDAELDESELASVYEGQTIELIVPWSPGGGTDVTARVFQPYITEYMPGNPEIQVMNEEGAGGILAQNDYAASGSDAGNRVVMSSGSSHMSYALQAEGVQFDYKDWTPVIGNSAGAMVFVRPETGVEEPEDLLDPEEPLVMAAALPDGSDSIALWGFHLLGVDVDPTFGYEGKGPSRVAFEQGESNIEWGASLVYEEHMRPLEEEGVAVPLYTVGQVVNGELERDPTWPDTPHLGEVYEEIHGEEPSGDEWEAYKFLVATNWSLSKAVWLHDDAPQDAIDAWRVAAEGMASDEELAADPELGDYELLIGDELESAAASMTDADQQYVDMVIDFLIEEHGLER